MSIHKLTAGSGYDYLTRQVAALDATDKGHTGLGNYYTERGESPGVWTGAGLAGIDGLAAGDVVTAEQMQALFGAGLHPLAAERRDSLQGPALTEKDYQAVTGLGVPFKVYAGDVSAFRLQVAKRVAGLNRAAGLPADWPVPATDRARVRTQVGREFFRAAHGREPADARELAAEIAKQSRPRTQAVAGYDLTFSPVKSVSALWAIADPHVAAAVERAHRAAVDDALSFLEKHALFTRTGTDGVRQVDVRGMVATAFTHRDSRAGDPDLHTHVAVANKVQTLDGRWLSIDGRVLFKATVAASETYNTALEHHLHDTLGMRFAERPNPDPRKRPVREIIGIDPALNQRWSARRASIETRRGELAAAFQHDHGRPPTPVESLHLAQQATLETRDAKHQPCSQAEQRATWHHQAVEVLGSVANVRAMVREVLTPRAAPGPVVDADWLAQASGRVLTAMEEHRSTWLVWHVRAEAQRQVRAAQLQSDRVEPIVDLLVSHVLQTRSVSLAPPDDGIAEPAPLRRVDGSSVYSVAGAALFTSARVLQAEQRLVATAGRRDGHCVDSSAVELALLEIAASGMPLNAGQAALVRQMCTSGARLQLGIAPAGAGKTTAMRALARAWTEGGGTVVGLAPSAAAAAALSDQIHTSTDTLAKLTWSIQHNDLPPWASQIGPTTLVVIDEAGMADTLSLDTAVGYIVGRGGSVRLIGDDQQLAAIGAGGVLRDIQATHGALRLTELLRFSDPAEAAASLALRDGRTEALGFYLDHHRVHVGDLATLTEDVFTAWQTDRSHQLDTIMLAPTRDLVSQLNQRARDHRLTGQPHGPAVRLADGNQASVGELIITRTNDRTLRVSATDWVKNGDRWTVTAVHDGGDLTVQHSHNQLAVRLPAEYLQASAELGYATTVHTAQGVSVDTMHGLASGQESRQQLYTMMTRGRHGNHIYLDAVSDGDPHSIIRPETVRPLTPTDLLEAMLGRDDAPRSATTLQRHQADPATLLGEATHRYIDALHAAAEHVAGHDLVETLEASADGVVPGLSDDPAWPTLRTRLIFLAAQGADPIVQLRLAAAAGALESAADRAAVLDWRLDNSGQRNPASGPLPWLPGIPAGLGCHPQWGDYLARRFQHGVDLTAQVRAAAPSTAPGWERQGAGALSASLISDVQVWRAAMQVGEQDRRPTGPPQLQRAARLWQRSLDQQLSADYAPALQEWGDLIERAVPDARSDDFTPILADRLAAISRAGIDARRLLHSAATVGPLPDDHAAAALWWRISRHLSPAVAADIDHNQILTTGWTDRLPEIVGVGRAQDLHSSPWWPALVSTIDHGLQRGWQLEDLLGNQPAWTAGQSDECQTMVWRASVMMDPAPPEDLPDPYGHRPSSGDSTEGIEAPGQSIHGRRRELDLGDDAAVLDAAPDMADRGEVDLTPAGWEVDPDTRVESELAVAAMLRDVTAAPEQTDADIDRMFQRALAWEQSPVTRERMLQINQLSLAYFHDQFPHSWGRRYLAERFGQDLLDDPRFQPGHAPAGWTGLVSHLRRHGISDTEITASGVATVASTGRIIDRFRDRVMFPIMHDGEVLGFVGRRHPHLTEDDHQGPKYLNTPDTPLFHKGAQLYGAIQQQIDAGAIPVIVEGPMDAIAVTIATAGSHLGVAALGTSLTDEQAAQLARLKINPVIATDADIAGRISAERAYWRLTPYGLDPTYATLPADTDPADLLTTRGPDALTQTLVAARPLAEVLIDERIAHLPTGQACLDGATIIAAQPPSQWEAGVDHISDRLRLRTAAVRRHLNSAVRHWNHDPRAAAQQPLRNITEVKHRLLAAEHTSPEDQWAPLARELDPRLLSESDWPALANIIQAIHEQGHDAAAKSRQLVAASPLGDLPAQDLRYRLVQHCKSPLAIHETTTLNAASRAGQERRRPPTPPQVPARPRR
jgi:DNA primase catalytic core